MLVTIDLHWFRRLFCRLGFHSMLKYGSWWNSERQAYDNLLRCWHCPKHEQKPE